MSIYINELISQNKLFIWIAENVFFSVILSYIDYAFFVYLFKVKTTKKQADACFFICFYHTVIFDIKRM